LFVYIVKFFVNICIGDKPSLVWLDTIYYYIDSHICILLVVKLCRSDTIRNILYFTFESCWVF